MDLYIASAWVENCDPFCGIVGTSPEQVENAINAAIEEMQSLDDAADAPSAEVYWSGVHPVNESEITLTPAQRQELLGGWVVHSYNPPDDPRVIAGEVQNAVGISNVFATEDEANDYADTERAHGWLDVRVVKVDGAAVGLEV